jgi:DNA-binding IclR family transcriptional regulator
VAISDEENLPGVFAAGAPVRDPFGNVAAAVSLACPAAMADEGARVVICNQVRDAAAQISRRKGAAP